MATTPENCRSRCMRRCNSSRTPLATELLRQKSGSCRLNRSEQNQRGTRHLIHDSEKDSISIVPTAGSGLAKSTSGLVRRGLQELSNLKSQRNLIVRSKLRSRILVVDDEEAIVEVFGTMLES